MNGNRFTGGSLPPGWSGMANLRDLSLYSTNPLYQLGGPLPPQWSSLTNLQNLEIDNNAFTSLLPVQWSAMASLTLRPLFALLYCPLPSLAARLNSVDAAQYLDIYNNLLTGRIPDAWTAIPLTTMYRTMMLDLAHLITCLWSLEPTQLML